MFDKKLVAVLNKSLEPGTAMNALSHASIALGAKLGRDPLHLVDYADADGGVYPTISSMPFIVLRATGGKIKTLDDAAKQHGIEYVTFTDAMTVGTWEEQLARSKATQREDLVFYGIVMLGESDIVTDLTKKFSLYR